MGYKVLKQGWRLIAILAIGFSSGCSGNEKIKGIDLDEVGYGSSVFSVLKGEDYESEALKLPEGVGEDITVKIKDVRNFSTKESEPLFFESCEVIGWSSPVDLNTDKTMEAVLAKYNPVQKATLSVDASTGYCMGPVPKIFRRQFIWLIWRLAVEASPKSKKAFVASS